MKVIDQAISKKYALYNGDSAEVMQFLQDNSMDYSIFSPPFEDLYTYSDSPRDLGNCRSTEEFYQQFTFIVKELYRIMKPGRLVSIHCMDLPTTKNNDGFIGLKDFPGILIKLFQECGFYYHSRVTIWKDPVVAMQRTKALFFQSVRAGKSGRNTARRKPSPPPIPPAPARSAGRPAALRPALPSG